MMKRLIWLVVVVSFFGCEKWDLEQKVFIDGVVNTLNVYVTSISTVTATGRLYRQGTAIITQHGHCWSSTNPTPEITDNKTELGILESPIEFYSNLPNLDVETEYYYRTYIIENDEPIYGDVKVFSIDRHTTNITNYEAKNFGDLIISANINSVYDLDDYGFCWSTINQEPNLNDEFIISSSSFSGTSINYLDTLYNLTTDEIIYMRAFARKGNAISYSEKVDVTISDVWIPKADFGGSGRVHAVSFAIGTRGYIATGLDITGNKKDLWEYESTTNIWTQKADLPGAERHSAVSFLLNDIGYVCTGINDTGLLNDVWAYNPSLNTWIQKNDFAGAPRYGAVSFTLNDIGYIGTGWAGNFYSKDFWEYNPTTDMWTRKADLGGNSRTDAISFSRDGKGYIGGGFYQNGWNNISYKDLWEYNNLNDTWSQTTNLPSTGITITMSINGKIYALQESNGFLYEYQSSTNNWIRKSDYNNTVDGIAFSINENGYVGTGSNNGTYTNDFYQYIPD